jgi:nucleotide-binding universal stress UspA family protein
MVRKVLCPTDLSRGSKDGIAYAIGVARENSAELIVFHAERFPFPAACPCETNLFYQVHLVETHRVERVLRDADLKLRQFMQRCFGQEISETAWRPKVAIGKAAGEIVTAACQEEVDLIIMAKTKRGFLSRFYPSVSAAVRRKAPCPVISGDPSQMLITLPWQSRRIGMIRAMLGYGV